MACLDCLEKRKRLLAKFGISSPRAEISEHSLGSLYARELTKAMLAHGNGQKAEDIVHAAANVIALTLAEVCRSRAQADDILAGLVTKMQAAVGSQYDEYGRRKTIVPVTISPQ